MGNLVFQATLGGQVSLVGPNTASTFTLNVPAVSSTLATLAANTFTGTQTLSTLTSPAATNLLIQSAGTTAVTLDTSQNATFAGKVASAGSLLLASNGTTTAVTIDASQNVGIGVTPSAWALGKNIDVGISAALNSDGYTRLLDNVYYNGAFKTKLTGLSSYYQMGAGTHAWFQAPSVTAGSTPTFTQAMTLDASGNLLVGTTTTGYTSSASTYYSPSVQYWINNHTTGTASGTRYIGFGIGTGEVGSITQNGTTGVLYNLTSDYRLKNNQEDLTGAKDFIMALKPKKWQWWDGSGEGVGFIAHEFMEVAKYSGHGEKDAVETVEIKDEDGNVTGTETRPVYQSIQPSSSEVMANLVAHIQNLETRLAALEAK